MPAPAIPQTLWFGYCPQAGPEFESVRFRLFRFRLRFGDQLSQLGSITDRVVLWLIQLLQKNIQRRRNLGFYPGVNVLVDAGLTPISIIEQTRYKIENLLGLHLRHT
jgi:hypothetical protein